jgi:hypothetical protein
MFDHFIVIECKICESSIAMLCVTVYALHQQIHSLLFVLYLDCTVVLF